MIRYFYLLYIPVTVVLIIYFVLFLKALSQLADSAAVIENKSQETEKLLSELDTKAHILENYQQKNKRFIATVVLVPFLFSQLKRLFKKKKKKQNIRISDIAALAQTFASFVK